MTETSLVTLDDVAAVERYSPAERASVVGYFEASRSASTRRQYASRWRAWEAWCEQRGIDSLPADAGAIAVYAAGLADAGKSVSTINLHLAAIQAAHVDRGLDSPTGSAALQRVRVGITRTLGSAPKKQAHPLSVDELRRMAATCDDTIRGLRDRAVLLLGFAGALRRSEVGDLAIERVLQRRGGLVLHLANSKGDQEGEGEYIGVPLGEHRETCPVSATFAWMEALGQESGPLFRPVSRHNTVPATCRGLSGEAVGAIVEARAEQAGLGHLGVTGHSLRAGHVTTATEAGIDPLRIARTTRHKSLDTLRIYARPTEALRDSTAGELGL